MIRYTAQRYGSNAWLHFDLPLKCDGPWESISTYETLTAEITPELATLVAEDGRKVIEPWGTWIHIESEDQREWTGIVDDVYAEGSTLQISVRDWIGYLDGLTFQGEIWGVEDDPADLVRELLAHVQSYPNGKLGATVVGSTKVRLGSTSEDKKIAADAAEKAAQKAYDTAEVAVKKAEAKVKKDGASYDKQIQVLEKDRNAATLAYQQAIAGKMGSSVIQARKDVVDAKDKLVSDKRKERSDALAAQLAAVEVAKIALEAKRPALDKAKDEASKWSTKVSEDGGAWKVSKDDLPDCWRILQDLATDGEFDFTTRTIRSNGAPKLELVIHPNGFGATRNDLLFEQGVNILEVPEISVPDEYASEIIATGAGDNLRVNIPVSDPRLRRTVTWSEPSVTKESVLRTRARSVLASLRVPIEIPEITVRDHVNTPIGSWGVGDVITVRLREVPHFGRVVVKHRIVSWQRTGLSRAVLRLEAV